MRTYTATAAALLGLWLSLSPARAATDHYFPASDGVRLHYAEAGHGQTVVFVPGWTMPAWIFDAQIADLSHFYHVVAFDPRSQGSSEVAASGHEPGQRGQDIADLLAQLGPAPVVLIGWSLGVLDSLAYLHTHGDGKIAGMVLIDNSVGENPPPSGDGAPPVAERRRGRRVIVSREAAMRNFVRGMFVRPMSASYIERLTQAALHTPPAAAAALLAYPLPRSYWREAVYSTRKPVLYIVRRGLAGQAGSLAANDPTAESIILNGVGHAMFVEDPARFDSLLYTFLQGRVWPG